VRISNNGDPQRHGDKEVNFRRQSKDRM
jgi:hypothetical protein